MPTLNPNTLLELTQLFLGVLDNPPNAYPHEL